MNAVIPPKKNRTTQRSYDEDLYKLRHLVENTFLHLKRWRGIATRYAKNTASFRCRPHPNASLSGPMSRDYII
jgi:transposase